MWVFVGPVLCFFLEVLVVIARKPSMFVKRFARSHRVAGLVYLAWLLLGFFDAAFDIAKGDDTPAGNRVYHWRVCYDAILGIFLCAQARGAPRGGVRRERPFRRALSHRL